MPWSRPAPYPEFSSWIPNPRLTFYFPTHPMAAGGHSSPAEGLAVGGNDVKGAVRRGAVDAIDHAGAFAGVGVISTQGTTTEAEYPQIPLS